MTIATRGLTSADLESMPNLHGVRYEIIDGELLVSRPPSFWHQFAAVQLGHAFLTWDPASAYGYMASEVGLARR
jgi:hypothetical protein